MPQWEQVYIHMQMYGRITTYDAFRKGITRLSARIYELKNIHNLQIQKHRVNYKACDGKQKHYDVYMLGGAGNEG